MSNYDAKIEEQKRMKNRAEIQRIMAIQDRKERLWEIAMHPELFSNKKPDHSDFQRGNFLRP